MFPEHQLCAVQAKHPLYHSCSPKRSAPEGTSEEEQLADGRMGFSSGSVHLPNLSCCPECLGEWNRAEKCCGLPRGTVLYGLNVLQSHPHPTAVSTSQDAQY